MALNRTQISALASLVDLAYELIILTYNIFTVYEIQAMTTEAQWLDTFNKPTKRGVYKGGNRMITYEICYKYGKLVWYVFFF